MWNIKITLTKLINKLSDVIIAWRAFISGIWMENKRKWPNASTSSHHHHQNTHGFIVLFKKILFVAAQSQFIYNEYI